MGRSETHIQIVANTDTSAADHQSLNVDHCYTACNGNVLWHPGRMMQNAGVLRVVDRDLLADACHLLGCEAPAGVLPTRQ